MKRKVGRKVLWDRSKDVGKPGRKRKANVERYESGRIDSKEYRDGVAKMLNIAFFQRAKFGATEKNCDNPLWGYPLGRMRIHAIAARDDGEGISAIQFDALKHYVQARHLSRWAEGVGREHPKSIAAEMVFGGICTGRDPDDEEVARLRRNYSGARSALLSAHPSAGVEWLKLVERLARDDESVTMRDLGEARMAANVLARHFGLVRV